MKLGRFELVPKHWNARWLRVKYNGASERMILPEHREEFLKAVQMSKGKANIHLCYELAIAGVPAETLAEVAEYLVEAIDSGQLSDKTGYTERLVQSGRQPKKIRTLRNIYAERHTDTCWHRLIESTFGRSVENIITSSGYLGGYGAYSLGSLLSTVFGRESGAGFCSAMETDNREYLPKIARACVMFKSLDESKRQSILKDEDITKHLVVRIGTHVYVPAELDKVYTNEQWSKKALADVFEDLYAISAREADALAPLTVKDLDEQDRWYRTVAEVGYFQGRIRNAKTLANYELSKSVRERLGIGLVSVKTGYRDSALRKNYDRMIARVLKCEAEYTKLLREGFSPDTARATVISTLEAWLQKHTDRKWMVFKRKDWDKEAIKVTPKKSRAKNGSKRGTLTPEEVRAILEETDKDGE